MKNINLEAGAVYRLKNLSSKGGYRLWRCTGIYHGAIAQESAVEFVALDVSNNGVLRVPFAMLWAMEKLEKVSGPTPTEKPKTEPGFCCPSLFRVWNKEIDSRDIQDVHSGVCPYCARQARFPGFDLSSVLAKAI